MDGIEIEAPAMLCAIANATCYGGGIRVAPMASVSDGVLDLVIVGNFGRIEFLRAFPQVLKGTHLKNPKVKHIPFRRLEISSNPAIPFLVDGELVGALSTQVEVVPGALKMVFPPL